MSTPSNAFQGIEPLAILYVDKRASDGGNGDSWQAAFRDLHDALSKARSYDRFGGWQQNLVEIRVAQGTYTPDAGSGDRNLAFDLSDGYGSAPTIWLRGSFAGLHAPEPDRQDFICTATVLSGDLNGDDGPNWTNREDNSRTILRAEGTGKGFFAMEGLQIVGASDMGPSDPSEAWWIGGALRVGLYDASGQFSLISLEHCQFRENQTRDIDGAAARFRSFTITLDSCDFEHNRTLDGSGGAVWWESFAPFSGQFAAIRSCRFLNNQARFGGASILNGAGSVSRCVLAANSADVLGGALFVSGEMTVEASLLIGNVAGESGGAIFAAGTSALAISRTTIVHNSAPHAAALDAPFAPLYCVGSIVWDCQSGSGGPTIDLGYGISESWFGGSLVQGGEAEIAFAAGGAAIVEPILDLDPRFIHPAPTVEASRDWEKWNYRLRLDSPAIRATRHASGNLMDLDGNNYRCPFLGAPAAFDLGAYFADACICWANLNADWDGLVDDDDFLLFVDAYNTTISPPALPRADLNRDGLVDDADFALFVAAYDTLLCN